MSLSVTFDAQPEDTLRCRGTAFGKVPHCGAFASLTITRDGESINIHARNPGQLWAIANAAIKLANEFSLLLKGEEAARVAMSLPVLEDVELTA